MTGSGGDMWVRLGDQVFESPTGAGERTGRPGLVTQVGRSFQAAHPQVPVLLDHGRHLVVDLSALDESVSAGHAGPWTGTSMGGSSPCGSGPSSSTALRL